MAANTLETPTTRTCKKCGKERDLSDFSVYTNNNGKPQVKSYCNPCSRAYSKQHKLNNPEAWKAYRDQYYKDNVEYFNKRVPYKDSFAPGVYMFKNILTGEMYIGAAKNMPRRVSRHFAPRGRSRNPYIYKSVKQYGKEAHVWGVLEFCDTVEQAFERETHYIQIYQPQWNTKKVTK
jgi:predicted GIY-YIG superfamily endonuclease